MRELLAAMKAAGWKLAVLTNKPHDRGIESVEAVYGKGYFDYILGEQEEFRKTGSGRRLPGDEGFRG